MLKAFHGANRDTEAPSWELGLRKFIDDTLLPVMQSKTPPASVIACWDGGNTLRLGLFPDYKKVRREKPQDKEAQDAAKELKEQCVSLLSYLGIRSVYVPGEEADDLIALLVERLDYSHCTVRTNDGDLTQLVGDKVGVWFGDTFCMKGGSYKGTPYELVPLLKALQGDSSDGYGGIPGFGPKAYERLAATYGNDGLLQIQTALEANDWSLVQAAFDATQDADLKKILEHWSAGHQCIRLARLHPEACYGHLDGKKPKRPVWRARVPNRAKVLEILTAAGVPSLIKHFEYLFPVHRLLTAADAEELPRIAQEIMSSQVVSYDYESTDKLKHPSFQEAKKGYVDVLAQELAGISVNYGPYMQNTIYLPVDHKDTANFPKEWVTWLLQAIDAREDRAVVQNASFELTVSQRNLGYMPRAPYDTKIMSSYADENEPAGLKDLSLRYLGYKQTSYMEVTQGRDMCELSGEEVLSYGCDDSLVTSHLFVLFRDIMLCEGSWSFYRENEIDPAVSDSLDFIEGTDIDFDLLMEFAKLSETAIKENSKLVREKLAEWCSPESPRQQDQNDVTQRALTLYQEWVSLKAVGVSGDPEAEQKLREETWQKAWASCFYQPMTKTVLAVPFVPSVTGINRVLGLIDKDAPKLTKASSAGVELFDGAIMDYIASNKPAARDELEEFVKVLFSARKKLSASGRSGPDYEALVEFCQAILDQRGSGKVVKTGDELNMGSGPQMQALLYAKLGLPIRKRSKVTKGSARDSNDLVGSAATGLKAIAAAFAYDLPEGEDWRKDTLEAYRRVALEQQNQSLYYKPYPLWLHPQDGRIHPGLVNCGTATRRPTGSSPNVLQVAKRSETKIRRIYRAGDYGDGERVVVSGDLANQEVVITACESKDPVMLAAFMATPRKDLHSLTATGFAHILLPRLGVHDMPGQIDYETFVSARKGGLGEQKAKVFNLIRDKYAKACNFLIAYLGGYTTLAGNLLIPNELAKELMASTFSLYPRLKPWQDEMIEFARMHGYTQTAYGTRRHAESDLWSSDDFLRKRQERQLVNAIIQGGAADILKVIRSEIYKRKMRDRYLMKAVRPVYDEITASVPIDRAVDYAQELVEVMSVVPPEYPVGMLVELSIGRTWGDQKEVRGSSREAVQEVLDQLGPTNPGRPNSIVSGG